MPNPLHTPEGAREVISAAAAAPSVHNTQPWRFRVRRKEAAELRVDIDRLLRTIDPRGRAMLISCGAALFNLRLAIRTTGRMPLLHTFPDELDDPALLAVVTTGQERPPSRLQRELYAAIPHRRTSRYPFADRPVPGQVLAELATAARQEGAVLRVLDMAAATGVLEAVRMAEEELISNADYCAELSRWTSGRSGRDGVPRYAFGPQAAPGDLPVRDFGVDQSPGGRPVLPFEHSPLLAVLLTPGDAPEDWLAAGQALQRVLLYATMHGVSAALLTQPLDVMEMRHPWQPRETGEQVQMILRLGYGPPPPATPRRRITDILDPAY